MLIDATNRSRHSTADKRLPVGVIKYHVDRQTSCEVIIIIIIIIIIIRPIIE